MFAPVRLFDSHSNSQAFTWVAKARHPQWIAGRRICDIIGVEIDWTKGTNNGSFFQKSEKNDQRSG